MDKKHSQSEFLPAALAIQEQPPSPAGRVLLFVLLALFCIGMLWASFGRVDIVVTAAGRVVPSGQVKVVQSPEAATVSRIHVRQGQKVQRGELLISLDTRLAQAESTRIAQQLVHLQREVRWREAFERWLASDKHNAFLENLELDAAALTALTRHTQAVLAKRETLVRELHANEAELRSVESEEKRTSAALAVLNERLQAYSTLMEKQYGARAKYLEMLQAQTEMEASIPVLRARQSEAQQRAAITQSRTLSLTEESRRENQQALASLSAQIDEMTQEAHKASERMRLLYVKAPVSGTVEELVLHTEGAVVTPAQILLKIVPEGAPVEIEAQLLNKDIGFVQEGQRAEVKVDAFNFTKYGLLHATVVDIGEDAVRHEQLGWVFNMRLALVKDSIAVGDRDVRLSPGMGVVSEVRTGDRKLIEFFLSPLLRYRQEGLRER